MLRVRIEIDSQAEDALEDWLWIQGAVSINGPANHAPLRFREALFDNIAKADFEHKLGEDCTIWPAQPTAIAWEEVVEQAWQESWRAGFQPLQAGRFTLAGEWEDRAEDPNCIRIYPGQAFGTGQHETTQLMLNRIQSHDLQGSRVLDIGCGTGILAIAAERLGAAEVFGFDADPGCETNMRHHLAINHTTTVSLAIGKIDDFALQPYRFILANITLNVLKEVWPRLPALLLPQGRLLCSGILTSQQAEAESCLRDLGFRITWQESKGEWVLLEAGLP